MKRYHLVCDECEYSADSETNPDTCPICGSPDLTTFYNKSIGHIEFVCVPRNDIRGTEYEIYSDSVGDIYKAPVHNTFNEFGQRHGRFLCKARHAVEYLDRVWGIDY